MRPRSTAWLAALLLAACGTGCAGSDDPAGPSQPGDPGDPGTGEPAVVTPVAERFPIDGQVDLEAVGEVTTLQVELRDGLGSGAAVGSVSLSWASAHDDRNVYLAFVWEDDDHDAVFDATTGPVDVDGLTVYFDDDGDGTQEVGEDGRSVLAAFDGTQYVDQHNATGDGTDLVGDGVGRIVWNASTGTYAAELLIPVADDAQGEDGSKSGDTRFDVVLFDHARFAEGSGGAGFAYGAIGIGASSATWPELPWDAVVGSGHPELPSDLTGLVAFVSTHEGGRRIYTFDPASGSVRRVTDGNPAWVDNVSLSHDRTRIAFHGAPSETAYADYEIYTVNVDGTGLRRLTDNQILDGHPGWSPEDDRIVYASFRGEGRAKLVLMTPEGEELAVLTPDGVDDNDPDFLPDGRIVFKTDRFSTLPQVRIATMNADGSDVRRLTSVSGVSDHDPVGDGDHVLFERFPRPTSYVTDPLSGFVGWNLVEVALDGSGERTVLADGWINWLPVSDPSGRYVAFLKGVGYTDLELMDASGRVLGRLLPGITRLHYMDWK